MGTIDRAERRQMDALTAGLPSKSAKMRRLAEAGYERADIARYLGVRYQFVYNVLAAPAPTAGRPVAGKTGPVAEETLRLPASDTPKWVWAEVGGDGQVVLPAGFLDALGLRKGDPVQLALEKDSIRVLTRDRALKELRAKVKAFMPDNVSLADELIAERRAEAAEESGE